MEDMRMVGRSGILMSRVIGIVRVGSVSGRLVMDNRTANRIDGIASVRGILVIGIGGVRMGGVMEGMMMSIGGMVVGETVVDETAAEEIVEGEEIAVAVVSLMVVSEITDVQEVEVRMIGGRDQEIIVIVIEIGTETGIGIESGTFIGVEGVWQVRRGSSRCIMVWPAFSVGFLLHDT